MTKPKTLKIDGQTVAVEWDMALGRFAQGYPLGGDYKKNRIRIAKGMTRSQVRKTLLHELMHHLWERADLHSVLSVKTEELVIDSLDAWMFTVLNENPDLRDFLFEDES